MVHFTSLFILLHNYAKILYFRTDRDQTDQSTDSAMSQINSELNNQKLFDGEDDDNDDDDCEYFVFMFIS